MILPAQGRPGPRLGPRYEAGGDPLWGLVGRPLGVLGGVALGAPRRMRVLLDFYATNTCNSVHDRFAVVLKIIQHSHAMMAHDEDINTLLQRVFQVRTDAQNRAKQKVLSCKAAACMKKSRQAQAAE